MRVYILHTVAHAPFSCLSSLNPFNILFVFLIVSVCSCVNRRLSEKERERRGWTKGTMSEKKTAERDGIRAGFPVSSRRGGGVSGKRLS